MKSILNYVLALAAVSSFIACGGPANKEGHNHDTHEHEAGAEQGECLLTYNADSTKMKWTAYKTTDKVGVSGTFNEVVIEGVQEAASVTDVFANATFKIGVGTVNSANPDRDKKISEHFFGTMASTLSLEGSVDEIGDDYALVSITMNGVTKQQKFDLKTDNATQCSIAASLDLNNWNAQQSITALNKICFDLHKGADGESNLWPDVSVELTVLLDKVCP